ncbi:MAG: PTS sugar transporter subunit IIA [Verrucomicrobiae bacterium]|nr:PTS sugar transporter subunit IIA [Verrucomicrobiae bacterium]
MRLQTLLQPSLIKLSVTETKRTAAIREVAELLRADKRIKDFEKFYQDLLTRERIETTCLGADTALPHARTDHVSDMVLAVGRSREGVLFENSNQTVRLIFLVGTPKRMATDYLRLVGTIARLLKQETIRQALLMAPDEQAFIEVLAQAELKL